ncbi:hypothetical protein [Variovorax saccharolyticus]|uniref:hypothetical protein n=1 Tax=Variovorax saccharolyticus TaxID=3053516 RepID=UPI00257819D4|nr:hypothetical protein [Variovorax sp. J22R187]MDM0018002.1 hypothetical protein [Variovorax sp. J22R187]
MEISRCELYRRVWEVPLNKLAKEFGVSDVGMAKACRRHKIPTPPVGHWMKVAHGKPTLKPQLPGTPETMVVLEPEMHRSPEASGVAADEFSELKVKVRVAPEDLASFAAATQAQLLKAKAAAGPVYCKGPSVFNCSVSAGQVQRAVSLLDAIERALSEVGAKVVRGKDNSPLHIDVEGETVLFSLTEKYSRSSFIPESERKSPFPRYDYEYHFSGDLKLTIDGYFDGRKSWSDGVRERLDTKLAEVVLGLVAAGRAMRKRRQEREAEHRKWEEEARIRAEDESRQRKLRAFRSHFAHEAAAWFEHRQAVAYLEHLRNCAVGDEALPGPSVRWLEIAEACVASLDPLPTRLQLLRKGYEPGEWDAPFGSVLVDEALPTSPFVEGTLAPRGRPSWLNR